MVETSGGEGVNAPRPGEVGSWCWHVHEDVLVERLTEPLSVRQAYVREHKKAIEIPTRLRLMRPVQGELPLAAWVEADAALVKADAAWVEASAARDKAYAAWVKADAAWVEADAALVKASAALVKASAAWVKADAAWVKADAALVKASAARDKAYAALQTDPATLALHAKECPDCPWDGTSIFPKREEGA